MLVTSEAVFAKLERGADLFLQGHFLKISFSSTFPMRAVVYNFDQKWRPGLFE